MGVCVFKSHQLRLGGKILHENVQIVIKNCALNLWFILYELWYKFPRELSIHQCVLEESNPGDNIDSNNTRKHLRNVEI